MTAKLSRKFYEQLGDDIANELVEWFNAVDATYKSDLSETNELHWGRFRAELGAESSAIRAELRTEIASLRAEMDRRFARVDVQIAELRAEMIKWMFVFWAGTVVPLAALMVALSR